MLKSFKMFISSFLILSIIFSNNITGIFAQEDIEKVYSLDFSEFDEAKDVYDIVPNITLDDGDEFFNTNDLDVIFAYQDSMNNRRMGGELWTVTSSKTYRPLGVVGGKYKEKLAAGESHGTTSSISFSISGVVQGATLGGTYQFSVDYTRNGPTGTEKVGSYKATHRYFTAVAKAKILEVNYKVTDKYTGALLRYETKYLLSNQETINYGILAYLNAGNGNVTIRSVANDSTKTMTESSFIKKLNSQDCWSTINF